MAAADKNSELPMKNEDPEITAMALKMKERLKKKAAIATKIPAFFPDNYYINKAGKRERFTNASTRMTRKIPEDNEYVESIKGEFFWKFIDGYDVPYIIRVINGNSLKLVPVRVVETDLLSKYIQYLHEDMYTCTSIKGYFISSNEAILFNEINFRHAECKYGRCLFVAGKDCIVSLDDAEAFYRFLDTCYKKLLCINRPGNDEKFGFVRINVESVVPYCTQDGQKYVPIFYFEGDTESLIPQAVKIENWNLAYLKFCFKVQGIRNDHFDCDSCEMVSLDCVKSCYPQETTFEEFWPDKVIDTELITNQRTNHVNPPGAWIKLHNRVVLAENTISQTLIEPVPAKPATPHSSLVTNNTHQNVRPVNQMVNSSITQLQPQSQPQHQSQPQSQSRPQSQSQPQPLPQLPSTDRRYSIATRNQSIASQSYNMVSTMAQGSNFRNGMGYIIRPPPSAHSAVHTIAASVIGNTISYSNVVPNSQIMTTVFNPMTNNYIVSQTRQIRPRNPRAYNNNQFQRQQQHQQQQRHQQQQQRITNPQAQQEHRSQIKDTIDLLSPPSSPVPPTTQRTYLRPDFAEELINIPERELVHVNYNNAAYKIHKTTLLGRTIYCINTKPYIYSDVMVTLNDLVQTMMPSSTVVRCAYVLTKYLNTTLHRGNSEQIAVLRQHGRLWSSFPDDTPMAILQNISQIIVQLQTLVNKKK